MDNTKNIWIGIVVIALIAGAYYFGTTSKNSTEPTENIQSATTPLLIQEQPPAKQPAPEVKAKTETPKSAQTNTQTNVITNSQACLTIANQAIQNEEAGGIMHDIKVLQAHFKQSTNNCYYEIQYPINGDIMTSIHYAPYDQTIATCANAPGVCYQSDNGYINEAIFHLIEAQYLAN